MIDIAVVDYGMGNLRSVAKALHHVAPERNIVITSDKQKIRDAQRVVLPGQSAMPDCMRSLDESGLREAVVQAAEERPFLGICLGLQMLFDTSEEGPTSCLGIVPGSVVRFRDEQMVDEKGERLKVPHMGWSKVEQNRAHPLWAGIDSGSRFYFAHSYFPRLADVRLGAATVSYPTPFTCAIARANIFAVQFHPEKSQHAGLQLLANFVIWNGND